MSSMGRVSILAWSTFSGVLLGAMIDVLIAGLWVAIATAMTSSHGADREIPRPAPLITAVILLSIPVAGGILGYLEGRLKL
jgi:hypothetical protein